MASPRRNDLQFSVGIHCLVRFLQLLNHNTYFDLEGPQDNSMSGFKRSDDLGLLW